MDSLKFNESTLAEDIDSLIDDSKVDDECMLLEMECKDKKIEEFRTSYRRLHNELKIIVEDKYTDT